MALALFSRPQAAGFTVIAPHFQLIICCLIVQSLLMKSAETINCSEPTTDGLLTALKENIFSKTEIRPVINLKTPTNISVTFTLYGILDVDEKAQKLNTFIWMNLFWNIEGLSWDPDECGTDRISIPRKQLWRPDIIINEFVDENKVPDTYYLYVQNTGKVVDDLPFHVISSCNLDIYTFPFDIQNCTFTFNSYQHTDCPQASGDSVCGEPPDSQLLPHYRRSGQLSSATPERGSFCLQNDPHFGLHCIPAANERPAARHRKQLTSYKFV
ncbi:hypothetical protein Q8A67_006212 [Cirrhinus molitorella]|uniref:Neurotransmitter-gated ion-channel ligand-binding domain-containing protein n=1 Tax=Cirrhinus molitorella TaxID=172907 RepID=A0AA88PZT3_9TELE|nr:hypothetical protein Q8A67_006212 [Cirrhinus molitorella]